VTRKLSAAASSSAVGPIVDFGFNGRYATLGEALRNHGMSVKPSALSHSVADGDPESSPRTWENSRQDDQ